MRQRIHNNQSVMLRLFHKTSLARQLRRLRTLPLTHHAHPPPFLPSLPSSSWASYRSVARAYPFFPFLRRNICYLIKALLNPCRSFIMYHLTYKVYINICYWKPFNFHAFRYKICLSACVDAQLCSSPHIPDLILRPQPSHHDVIGDIPMCEARGRLSWLC